MAKRFEDKQTAGDRTRPQAAADIQDASASNGPVPGLSGKAAQPGRRPIPVREVKNALGIDISTAAVGRWIYQGVGGIRLKATKLGGRVYVLPEDLDAFINALNAIKDREPIRVRHTRRPASQVQSDSVPQEVEAKLEAIFGTRRRNQQPRKEG